MLYKLSIYAWIYGLVEIYEESFMVWEKQSCLEPFVSINNPFVFFAQVKIKSRYCDDWSINIKKNSRAMYKFKRS